MKSFQTLYDRFTTVTSNDATSNQTLGKALLNESQDVVLAANNYRWPFLEKTADLTSVESQEAYELPEDFGQFISFRFEVSSSEIYRTELVEDYDYWEYLQSLDTDTSDVIQKVYIQDNQILLWPQPSSGSKTMRLRYYQKGKDMTQADYTTGTITTATNGDETIVGDSTVWTAGMAGNWMRITAGAAASLGDGQWYEIDSITDNTNLELVKTYGGTSISSASANYTIGEMPLIPGAFHDIILWRALAIYYDQNPDAGESSKYWMRYDGGYEAGLSPRMGGMLKRMFETEAGTGAAAYMPPYGASHKELDPNLFPRDLTAEDWP